MVESRLNGIDSITLKYHVGQWNEPYRSTVHFCDFIADELCQCRKVVDFACGAGAPTGYLAGKFPKVKFLGLDISRELIGIAASRETAENLVFSVDNLDDPRTRYSVDMVLLQQTLHTLPSPGLPMHMIATRLRPKWVGLSTLIYEGNIDCKIEVMEQSVPRKQYYNIFGLPGLVMGMATEGYNLKRFKPFQIDCDLPMPSNPDVMGTYTINTEKGRLQCSGPLILPWGFAMFERHDDTH